MMTPETDHEKQSLKMIAPDDVLKVASRWGTFGNKPGHMNYQVAKCQGDYYRVFPTEDSLMFVIEDNHDTKNS